VSVNGLASGVAAISAGALHTCALLTTGGVRCWGAGGIGQLGNGGTNDSSVPVNVSTLGSGVAAIASGSFHACALTSGGGVKCWGSNLEGELGNGLPNDSSTPVNVSTLASGVASISAGGYHSCALTTGGGARCWGSNYYGQLGDGTNVVNRRTPVVVVLSTTSGRPFVSGIAIATGDGHTCALTSSAGVQCWGNNASGELGDGTTALKRVPVDVLDDASAPYADLAITKTHLGNFYRNQPAATYTITVTNAGNAATRGMVTVTDTIPAGLTATAIAGAGWTCTLNSTNTDPKSSSCTRSDVLAPSQAYPPITLTVSVGSGAGSSLTNTVALVGGDYASNDTATDPTIVNATPSHNADLVNLALSAGTLSPTFSSGTQSYATTLANSITAITVTPTLADASATVRVNGSLVASGTPSPPVSLNVGANMISTVTTAQDGATTKTYAVNLSLVPLAQCAYVVTPTDVPNFPAPGGPTTINVATVTGCPVNVLTPFQPWVTLGPIVTGTNATTVQLQISANGGPARATTLVLAGRLFLVTQVAGP
jgi:hypothetical protein